eukprot:14695301-Alexandrium_andersonii.AAC.1
MPCCEGCCGCLCPGASVGSWPRERMASARVQRTRSLSARFHPTALTPAATLTMLAREMIHWSTSGGTGTVSRATGLVAP